jgi:hypothetical protein
VTTWVLTPSEPNPLTGFANPVLGWQLTLATAMDALTGCNIVYAGGWVPQLLVLSSSAPTAPIWQLILNKGNVQVTVNDTDWFAFDGQNAWAVPQNTVEAEYTVTEQTSPGGS